MPLQLRPSLIRAGTRVFSSAAMLRHATLCNAMFTLCVPLCYARLSYATPLARSEVLGMHPASMSVYEVGSRSRR